eukprot:6588193-Alexandrium_andersonii.AAC.1
MEASKSEPLAHRMARNCLFAPTREINPWRRWENWPDCSTTPFATLAGPYLCSGPTPHAAGQPGNQDHAVLVASVARVGEQF